jgi:phosphate transport system substrate-binding protein
MPTGLRNALLTGGLFLALAATAEAAIHLTETGSTILYPILTVWIEHYVQPHGPVKIDAAPTGSGFGIGSAMHGSAQIGGSDAYLTDAQMQAAGLMNIPLAVSAQEIVYNVPELRSGSPLHVTGAVLAGIYDGTIAMWDDPKISALNTGQTLPHHAIVTVRRADSSGDTFMFTQLLAGASPTWDQTVHFGTEVHWPKLRKALEADGNADMINTASSAAYSIAYVGISYAARAHAAGLGVAALQNRSGAFVLPTVEATSATAESMASHVPSDGRLSLIDTAAPEAYPLVNFVYAIVKDQQKKRGVAAALRAFLSWVVAPDKGNDPALLAQVNFAPLPARVRDIALRQISTITGP